MWYFNYFAEIPKVVQTQGIASEDNGNHEPDDERYEARTSKWKKLSNNIKLKKYLTNSEEKYIFSLYYIENNESFEEN